MGAQNITPLMRACDFGHKDIVLYLLEARASPVQCDSHGWTALCYALGSGEVEIASLLLSRIDKKKSRVQKDTVARFRREIFAKCESEVGLEALQNMKRELAPTGLLALPMSGELPDIDATIRGMTLGPVPGG